MALVRGTKSAMAPNKTTQPANMVRLTRRNISALSPVLPVRAGAEFHLSRWRGR